MLASPTIIVGVVFQLHYFIFHVVLLLSYHHHIDLTRVVLPSLAVIVTLSQSPCYLNLANPSVTTVL